MAPLVDPTICRKCIALRSTLEGQNPRDCPDKPRAQPIQEIVSLTSDNGEESLVCIPGGPDADPRQSGEELELQASFSAQLHRHIRLDDGKRFHVQLPQALLRQIQPYVPEKNLDIHPRGKDALHLSGLCLQHELREPLS